MNEDRELLHRIHVARLKAHGWSDAVIAGSPWPRNEADWRQTAHGAPWDSNVYMARWHLAFHATMQELLA